MKTKRVELGDVFYVFTNWGICKGRVTKIIDEMIETDETSKCQPFKDGKMLITGTS